MTDGGGGNWVTNFSSILFAERTTIHQPTRRTPFWMNYGREAVLPIETRNKTWRILEREKAQSRADLLAFVLDS